MTRQNSSPAKRCISTAATTSSIRYGLISVTFNHPMNSSGPRKWIMSQKKSAVTRRTALAGFGGGLLVPGLASRVQAAESSEPTPAATGAAHAVSPRGLLFANPTFHFETLRNAGYIVSNCADLGEIL